jgi:hypothetical protein
VNGSTPVTWISEQPELVKFVSPAAESLRLTKYVLVASEEGIVTSTCSPAPIKVLRLLAVVVATAAPPQVAAQDTTILPGAVLTKGQPLLTVTLTWLPIVPEEGAVDAPRLTVAAAWPVETNKEHPITWTKESATAGIDLFIWRCSFPRISWTCRRLEMPRRATSTVVSRNPVPGLGTVPVDGTASKMTKSPSVSFDPLEGRRLALKVRRTAELAPNRLPLCSL